MYFYIYPLCICFYIINRAFIDKFLIPSNFAVDHLTYKIYFIASFKLAGFFFEKSICAILINASKIELNKFLPMSEE
jgi:hypothetical protein